MIIIFARVDVSFTVALSVNNRFCCETHNHSALHPNDFLENVEILPTNKKNQHNKLDEDGGPEFGVNGCCTEDRLLVSPINDPLLKPDDIYFIEPTNECMKYIIILSKMQLYNIKLITIRSAIKFNHSINTSLDCNKAALE